MPLIEIPAPDSTIKVYKHATLRRILSEDLNTLSGVNYSGSQLEILNLFLKTLIGKDANQTAYFGFAAPAFSANEINLGRGIILTGTSVFRLAQASLTPTPEAHWGIYELELVEEDSDAVARDFFDLVTESPTTALSATRRAFRLRIFESYNTTPAFPGVTPGRIKLLEYKKAAAFQPLTEVTRAIAPDVDLLNLLSRIVALETGLAAESAARATADDAKNFIRPLVPVSPDEKWQFKRIGNAPYWSIDGGVNWLPFA